MNDPIYSSDVAFTPSVKAVQVRKGSRRSYKAADEKGSWETRITADLALFIAEQTSIFLATVNAAGQPYIQPVADRQVSCACSTTRRWPSPITLATGNTSRKATLPTIRRPISF